MNTLYPEIKSPTIYELDLDGSHQLYVEECGNRHGVPIIFLHGGPGSGCQPYHRQFFDPEKYRIVLFDQRGCGRSKPHGSLKDNTTHQLIADMETIRLALDIDEWVLFGGSWGVTLALLYAQTYPKQVSAMILRGSFLASQRDLEWFFGDGVGRIFPDEWEQFTAPLTHKPSHYIELIQAYQELISSSDSDTRLTAANAWSRWTGKIVTWTLTQNDEDTNDNVDVDVDVEATEKLIRSVQLEIHYAANNYFIEQNQLLNSLQSLPEVPVKIVHGRRDITCPLESSWQLHQRIANSELRILSDSGHLANEVAMIDALISMTDDIATLLTT